MMALKATAVAALLSLSHLVPTAAASSSSTSSEGSFRRRLKSALLDTKGLSPLASEAASNLLRLCEMPKGGRKKGKGKSKRKGKKKGTVANPRVTCTDGNAHATDFIARYLKKQGLVPAGDDGTYVQTVSGSVDETLCPHGIRNVAGYVRGTLRPDEFVVYSAHIDGSNNENPQTDLTRDVGSTGNVYDDGLAVAVGMAMAKELAENPPDLSVLFLFDDGEEGWFQVGLRDLGEQNNCEEIVATEWYRNIYLDLGGREENLDRCLYQPIGSSYWAKYPTIDLAAIRAMYVIDPLGSPFNADKQALAVIGGERVKYGDDGSTINDYLDEVLLEEEDTSVMIVKTTRAAAGFASAVDAVTGSRYQRLCGDDCLDAGGVPAVWLAQPSFQKYHGGGVYSIAKDLFGAFTQSEGTFPNLAYFSVDDLSSIFLPTLDDMASFLRRIITDSATIGAPEGGPADGLLVYDGDRGSDVQNSDIVNALEALQVLILLIDQDLPEPTATVLKQFISGLQPTLFFLSTADLTVDALQSTARQLLQLTVALVVSMDFFNENYPEKEAFIDQGYGPPPNSVEREDEAPPQEGSRSKGKKRS